jgi:ribokinase
MCQFFVVGDATVDQMYFVSDLPEAGGEVTALRALMEPGGAGGTLATVLARLGNRVRIATRVGRGPFADLALRHALAAGVETDLIQIDEEHQTSSVTLLVTPDAQRTMISAVGASRYLDVEALARKDIADCDALVMSAYSLVGGQQRDYAVRALAYAKEAGLTTFIDLGRGAVGALKGQMIALVRDVDYLLMNENELFTLTDEETISDALSVLTDRGIERVVVKVGENGSIVVTPELTELVDPLKVDEAIDTTGAGDYYTAAFAHAIMSGYELLEAARIGNVAGALNTTHVGAQSAVVDLDTLDRLAQELDTVGS